MAIQHMTSDGLKWDLLEEAEDHEAYLETNKRKEEERAQAAAALDPQIQAFADHRGLGEGPGRTRVTNLLHEWYDWLADGEARAQDTVPADMRTQPADWPKDDGVDNENAA